MQIGFIGLGLMGSRMALNLSKAGYHLNIYNRTRQKADKLISDHVKCKSTPGNVGAESDVVITMLSTPDAVQQVALGDDGFLHSMKKGNVWIDCSTVNPSFSKEMAEITATFGFNFLDAPVGGSIIPAEKGELIFMVGGKKSIVRYCEPLLKAMGNKIIHVGDHGMGTSLKLVNNLVMGLSVYAFTEGLILGESLGISKEKLFDFFNGSPVAAPIVNVKKKKIMEQDFSPEFPLQWLHKDLQLASATAWEQGIALPGTNAVKEIFALAKQQGLSEKDFTAIYSFLKK